MKKMLFLLSILLLKFLLIEAISENDTRLVLLQVTARHGSRTVLRNYPNDINQAYWDMFGLGQLLPAGMKQMQDYGVYLTKRYENFLNLTYSPARAFVRSTGYDRTLQSAEALLSGIFQPSSFQKWTSIEGKTGFMPIPIHSNDKLVDPILHQEAPCPRYSTLKAQTRASEYYQNQTKTNEPFIDLLRNLSGIQDLKLSTISQLGDKFSVQTSVGLPNEKYLVENAQKILDLQTNFYYYDNANLQMAAFSAGGLLNEIVENMKEKQTNSNSTRQFYLYLIHDSYVASLFKLLNPSSNSFFPPEYVSGYIFELRSDMNGAYYVQVLLKNNKVNEPINPTPVKIEGCDVFCPFDKFVSLLQKGLISDFTEVCKEKSNNS